MTLPPQVIHAGTKQGVLVVSATPDAPLWSGSIRLLATAKINGKAVTRAVRSATTSWQIPGQQQNQQNLPVISRVDRDLVLAVRERGPYNLIATKTQFTTQAGGKIPGAVETGTLLAGVEGGHPGDHAEFAAATDGRAGDLQSGKDTVEAVIDVKNNAIPGVYTLVCAARCR